MGKTYKSFDTEFKKTVVSLHENGTSISELSREYGVNESTIRSWVNKYGSIITSTGEVTTNEELAKLRKENQQLKTENDILKKVVAIFSKK